MTKKVEMKTCHTIPDDKIPYYYRSSKGNRPEFTSPDRVDLLDTKGDESVYSVKIDTIDSDGEPIIERIVDQWNEGEEAVLQLPDINGRTNWARVVGVDAPEDSENFPRQNFVKVFIELDKELNLRTWHELE
jgi:hypothetical protein